MLTSLSPGFREDTGSLSIFVVSEEPDLSVEEVMAHLVEEVIIGGMAWDGCVWAGMGECNSYPELVVPTSVTAVCVEG